IPVNLDTLQLVAGTVTAQVVAGTVTAQAGQTVPVDLAATFLEGLASFVAPCVLPLVPGYLSYISGVSVSRAANDGKVAAITWSDTQRVLVATLFFIFGFTLGFIAIFGIYDTLAESLGNFKPLMQVVAGIIVIIFGLHFLGVFRIGFLNMEKRLQIKNKPAGLIGAGLVGFAFAFGWSPCVGPFLAASITNASSSESFWSGIALMIVYAAGLGVPFLLAGLFMNRFLGFMARLRRHFHMIELASGVLLILVGLLILSGNLTKLSEVFNTVRL
ncbi:MAG: cytochrome c biogenesis protein CcdA, partial [Chloroflexota bacterium]